ncbi:unnamed protein product [Musa acuminata var. zebrina]
MMFDEVMLYLLTFLFFFCLCPTIHFFSFWITSLVQLCILFSLIGFHINRINLLSSFPSTFTIRCDISYLDEMYQCVSYVLSPKKHHYFTCSNARESSLVTRITVMKIELVRSIGISADCFAIFKIEIISDFLTMIQSSAHHRHRLKRTIRHDEKNIYNKNSRELVFYLKTACAYHIVFVSQSNFSGTQNAVSHSNRYRSDRARSLGLVGLSSLRPLSLAAPVHSPACSLPASTTVTLPFPPPRIVSSPPYSPSRASPPSPTSPPPLLPSLSTSDSDKPHPSDPKSGPVPGNDLLRSPNLPLLKVRLHQWRLRSRCSK